MEFDVPFGFHLKQGAQHIMAIFQPAGDAPTRRLRRLAFRTFATGGTGRPCSSRMSSGNFHVSGREGKSCLYTQPTNSLTRSLVACLS